ncbi:putative neck protein [Serratia phage Tsm2]|uniref:Putative neck protein n=1 Tax=Serratia phage Tsm2 TaxID=2787014 RepID=A0A7S9XC45_9CAUD|nr:putative neck protein [Serratia phage Tsm2]QPI13737.1 putative neck protein [Serratia phage Tsm2]
MSVTKDQLFALIGAKVPDNTSGLITPTGLREVLTQTADSMLYAAKGVREVELLRAASTATQAPSAVDTPLQLTFGAAQLSATDPVMLNSAGVVTFNTAGAYAVRIKLQNGRTGATGTSVLLSRLLINGAPVGSTAAVKMTQTDATTPTESRVVVQATAGQTFTVQIMRDSSGSNFGGVYPQVATVAAWGTAPSALLVISRLEPVP